MQLAAAYGTGADVTDEEEKPRREKAAPACIKRMRALERKTHHVQANHPDPQAEFLATINSN